MQATAPGTLGGALFVTLSGIQFAFARGQTAAEYLILFGSPCLLGAMQRAPKWATEKRMLKEHIEVALRNAAVYFFEITGRHDVNPRQLQRLAGLASTQDITR